MEYSEIKNQLSKLRKSAWNEHFEYFVGNFMLQIFTDSVMEHNSLPEDILTDFPFVDINVLESTLINGKLYYMPIYLSKDARFNNYQPIQYREYGVFDGQDVPLDILCELIIYLQRLSKLTTFM